MEAATKQDYKQTEVGLIPNDWEVGNLKEISTIITKGTTPRYFSNIGVNFIKIECLKGDNIEIDKCLYIDDNINKTELKRSILVEGDILFAIAGATIGKCAIVQSELIPANTNQALAIIRLREIENQIFIFYLLKSTLMQKYIIDNIAGGAQPNLNLEQIGSFSFPIPPLPEQKAIATALKDTDDLIQSLEKLIAKKKIIKQGAMQELLNPKEDWVIKKLGEVFDFINTASFSRANLNENGDIGYIHYGDIHVRYDNILDLNKTTIPHIDFNLSVGYDYLKDGDLVIADASEDINGVGKCIEIKNINDKRVISGLHTYLIRTKSEIFVTGFLSYMFSSKQVKMQIDKLTTGMKVYGITKNNLKTIDIAIPTFSEQIEISNTIFDIDNEIESLEFKLSKYKTIKQGMMQQLLTGKIRLV